MWLLRSSPWNIRDSPSAHASSPSVSPSSSTVCSGRSLPWEIVACESSTGEATLVTREAVVASSSVLHCRCTTSQAPDVVELADIERLALELVPYVVVVVCILYTLRLLYRVRRDITTHSSAPKRWRCATIDTFRGVTLCMMIFVNYGGGGMAVFQHSAWDGMTAADVVFPWFAWIMGFTMRLGASNGNKVIGSVSKVLTRCLKLFLLGLFLNNGRNWAEWRIPGVLQALGTAYLICFSSARLVDCLMARRSSQASGLPLIATHSIVAIAPLVLINLFVTFLLPVPGCPTGYIGPGGDSDGGAHRNCTGGAHLYLDRLMFGETHIFQTPTCKAVFHTGPFDPEGVLNWLMIAVTAYLGYIAGIMYSTGRSKLKTQVLAGAILFLAAALVSGGFGVVERGIPLNKNLWSLSYVLMSSALAHFAFALLHFFGDDEFARSSFAFVGRNPIFLYVMHEVLQSYVPFSVKPSAEVGPSSALLLLHNVAGVLWWIFMAEWLHARGIYMSV